MSRSAIPDALIAVDHALGQIPPSERANPSPASEAVARELLPLVSEPAVLNRVWKQALDNARHARNARWQETQSVKEVRRLVKATDPNCLTSKAQDVMVGLREVAELASEVAGDLSQIKLTNLGPLPYDELDRVQDQIHKARSSLKTLRRLVTATKV